MYLSKSSALALLTVLLLAIGAVGFADKTEALLKSGQHQMEGSGTGQESVAGTHTMPNGEVMQSGGNEKDVRTAADHTADAPKKAAAQKHAGHTMGAGTGDCSM